MYSDELYHYGVGHSGKPPGRGSGRYAWGSGGEKAAVRRERREAIRSEMTAALRERRETIRSSMAENRPIKKDRRDAVRNRRLMTDEELNQRIARLEKEKKLYDLTKQDLQRGRSIAEDIAMSTGKKVGQAALTTATTLAVTMVFRKYMGDEAANLMKALMKPKK